MRVLRIIWKSESDKVKASLSKDNLIYLNLWIRVRHAALSEWELSDQIVVCLNAKLDFDREHLKLDEASRVIFRGVTNRALPSKLLSPMFAK